MVAYLTWSGIPLPRSLVPVARRAQQPLVPPPRPGTYGNGAVARTMARGAEHQSPENRDHHHLAPVARHSSNQGHKCARSSTIGGRPSAKPNGLHVLHAAHPNQNSGVQAERAHSHKRPKTPTKNGGVQAETQAQAQTP